MPEILQFNFYTKIITVPSPDTTLDLQYLINSIREAEDDINPGMAYPKIADAYGKQDLGGGVRVGITVVMLDGWRVAFEARPGPDTVSVSISGGNFVGEAGANPISPTEYTQVTVQQSTSASIATPPSDTNLVYLVESLRNSHPAFGSVWYWDPYAGSDTNDGTTPSTAVQTFAQAHTLAGDNSGDVIFARATNPSGTTTVTENLSITKSTLKLRGPGNNLVLDPSSPGSATVTIAADNVEVSGFFVGTATGGTDNAFTLTGDNILIRDVWISGVTGHGIALSSSSRPRILTSAVENCTGHGIELGTNTTQALISKALISGNTNGINLTGTGIADNVIENSLIYKNSGYGVEIGSGVARTTLRAQNTIINNTTGNTQDSGTETYIEAPSGGESASAIADAVWDEVIASHTVAGSAGKTLKDIKTRATLASIK